MTNTQLQAKQKEIENRIIDFAKNKNLSSASIEPIVDGIADAKTYLSSRKKILWVLKEPYDDIGSDGKPEGGGWSINRNFIDNPEKCAKNMTDQVITYASYGILNNIDSYQSMDYIEDNPDMLKALTQIAYINISKMPNFTASKDNQIAKFYTLWKDILFTQFETYSPDIIIFGNTFKYFRDDLFPSGLPEPKKYAFEDREYIYSYRWNNELLLDAFHPNARKDRTEYIDSILQCVKNN